MSSEYKMWMKSDDEDSSIDKYKYKKEKPLNSSSDLNGNEIDDHIENHAALSAQFSKMHQKVPKKKMINSRKRGTVIVETD